jgi:hypothetical protein
MRIAVMTHLTADGFSCSLPSFELEIPFGSNRVRVRLASGVRLTPGLYLMRLSQGAAVHVGRVVVLE